MKKVAFVLAVLVVLGSLMGIPVSAAENEAGNAWVYDEAGVISAETEEYIRNLNESVFAGYKDKPQLAIVMVNDLPYDIDEYKLDLFNEFGVGTAEENRGMLFLLAINDREYCFEIGDGFEKGSLLRKDLEKDFITEDMKDALRSEDYDSVVLGVARYLAGLMTDAENGIYSQREAEILAARTYALDFTVSFPEAWSSLIFRSQKVDLEDYQNCSFLIQNIETGEYLVGQYSDEHQEYVVSGSTEFESQATWFQCGRNIGEPGDLPVSGLKMGEYRLVQSSVPYGYMALEEASVQLLAEHAIVNGSSVRYKVYSGNHYVTAININYTVNEAEQAVLGEDRSLTVFGIILFIGCPAVGLIALAGFVIYKALRTRKIRDLIERNYRYIPSAKTTKEEFLKYMNTEQVSVPYWELEEKFLALLYLHYYEKHLKVLDERAPVPERLHLYVEAFRKANTLQAFQSGLLVSVDMIFYQVDEAEREKAEMKAKNAENIEKFFADNERRIENKAIAGSVWEQLERCVFTDRILSEHELEALFADVVNEFGFKWEFDRFCKENQGNIDVQDFDKECFYREVTSSDHYWNYRAGGYYDRSWMTYYLMRHMSRQRKQREERERREEAERQARERRRRQEEARRASERMRSNNSSFGSGFKGGSSSGGGFKGKW